jgi:uroporphyrinogen decarboxylase
MNSKERVLTALEHREPDRVPLDYGALPAVTQRLCTHLALDPTPNPGSYQAYPEALLQRLHVDIRIVRPAYLGYAGKPLPEGGYIDNWGVTISKEGYPVGHPLAEASSVADIYAHPFPDPDAYDYAHYAQLCDQAEGYAVCGGDWSPFFTWSLELMGTERFLLSLHEQPEVASALLTRVADYYFETSRRMFEAARGKLDIFFMGDDYGTQRCPFVHPRDFRTFMLPHLRRLYGQARSYGLKVMQHSCGSVRPMLDDLLSIGLDALDPVQVRAEGMEMAGLKRDFGSRLTFHGSIDTQHTLPHGTAADVRREVLERLRVAAPGGGLILCGSQDYIADIPLENIVALYDTAFEFGSYPIRLPGNKS